MVGNSLIRRRIRGAVKRNFRPYHWRYTSPNEHFEYGYPHSNALFNIYSSKAQHFASNWSLASNVKQLCQPITSDVTYDVGAPTVYRRIYWCKLLTISNQTSRYILKCIRMWVYHTVMCPKDADGMANSVDPHQTAPLEAVWSESTPFAQTSLSKTCDSHLWSNSCDTK